jgi:hypothetical protein
MATMEDQASSADVEKNDAFFSRPMTSMMSATMLLDANTKKETPRGAAEKESQEKKALATKDKLAISLAASVSTNESTGTNHRHHHHRSHHDDKTPNVLNFAPPGVFTVVDGNKEIKALSISSPDDQLIVLDHATLEKRDMEENDVVVDTPALLVATQLVNPDDEDANRVGEEQLETKIQQELESRLLKQNQEVVLAEPMTANMTTTIEQINGKEERGWKRTLWCYGLIFTLLLVSAIVTGIVVSNKNKQGTFEKVNPRARMVVTSWMLLSAKQISP